MAHLARLVLLGFTLCGLAGCANQAFSPPGGWVPAEAPDPLAPGERRLGLAGGGGSVGLGGSELWGGRVRYRQGLEHYEVQGELAAVVLTEPTRADTFPGIISGKIGVKGRLGAGPGHASWNAALGLGGSEAGPFLAPEAGAQLGYLNRYVVPWGGLSALLSLPVNPEQVDLARAGDDAPNLDRPLVTVGLRAVIGLTVHAGPLDLQLAMAWLRLWDVEGKAESVTGLSLGVDFAL